MKFGIPCLALMASGAGAGAFAPSSGVSPIVRATFGYQRAFGMLPHGPPVQTLSSRRSGVTVALKSSNLPEVDFPNDIRDVVKKRVLNRREKNWNTDDGVWNPNENWSDDDDWDDSFVRVAAEFLSSEGNSKQAIISAAVGLIMYDITNEEQLKNVAGAPPVQKNFREALSGKGIPDAICDSLFIKYVQPTEPLYGPLSLNITEAYAQVKEWAQLFADSNGDPDFCYPNMMKTTWNEDELKARLQKHTHVCNDNMAHDHNKDDRSAFVVAIQEGLGNGKTHAVQVAPSLLNAPGIYVTYNGEQDIRSDLKDPGKCILLRILFAALGTDNLGAADFLAQASQEWKTASNDDLLDLAVYGLQQIYGDEERLCICVDELRKIATIQNNVELLLSMLGNLAKKLLHGEPSIQCSVIVTALTESTVLTISGRKVELMSLPPVDGSAIDHIIKLVLGVEASAVKDIVWKVAASAGNHMRSIVVATQILQGGHASVDLQALFNRVFERLSQNLPESTATTVINYVKESCRTGIAVRDANDALQIVLGRNNAVPPSVLCSSASAAKVPDGSKIKENVMAIFENTINSEATKQLEKTAMHYDLLRSNWGLRVLPDSIKVKYAMDLDLAYYTELQLPPFKTISDESLFRVEGKEVVWAGLKPNKTAYYHPSASKNPWVDRFFFVGDGSNRCLILYQDKINATSFGDAVAKLNLAAEMAINHLDCKVLCIANVIGASTRTTAQNNFKFPHVLVRDSEIDKFYTSHFAPAIRVLRERFLASN